MHVDLLMSFVHRTVNANNNTTRKQYLGPPLDMTFAFVSVRWHELFRHPNVNIIIFCLHRRFTQLCTADLVTFSLPIDCFQSFVFTALPYLFAFIDNGLCPSQVHVYVHFAKRWVSFSCILNLCSLYLLSSFWFCRFWFTSAACQLQSPQCSY